MFFYINNETSEIPTVLGYRFWLNFEKFFYTVFDGESSAQAIFW